jgi:hypothetical protein
MTSSLQQEVRCACGEEFQAHLYGSVDAEADPALREGILSGQLNVVPCPGCARMVYAERFILYHEPSNELMVFVYPFDYRSERVKWERKTLADFDAAQASLPDGRKIAYPPVSAFGLDELVRRLEREQEERDQGEILEALAPSLSLDVRALRPSDARRRGLPARLPLAAPAGDGESGRVRRGLEALLRVNDRLTVYAELMRELPKVADRLAEAG